MAMSETTTSPRARRSRTQCLIERRQMAEWLVRIGYPLDFTSEAPCPGFLRQALAEAWYRASAGEGETVADYLALCAAEGVWA